MTLEFFTDTGRGFAPKASVRKQGQIGLNRGAIQRYNIKEGMWAVLGYDAQKQMVAIKLTEDANEAGANKIILRDNNASIAAKGFCEYFEVPGRDKTRAYPLRQDEASGYLIFFPKTEESQDGSRTSKQGTPATDTEQQ